MRLKEIQFGSLLTFCPHGDSTVIRHSKDIRTAIKRDDFVVNPLDESNPILMSEWIGQTMQQLQSQLPFTDYFGDDAVLVPTPGSSLMGPNTLWVPERISNALVGRGFGMRVVSCLRRTRAVPKAAFSLPENRLKPIDHYGTMEVQANLAPPSEMVLVDDIITRGATLLDAANRLSEAFPDTRIRA